MGSIDKVGWRSWLWGGLPVQLYQAWLLILYTGLALRENTLRVNGSDIRPWREISCSLICSSSSYILIPANFCHLDKTSLLRYGHGTYQGVQLFLQWAIMQGVAMLLQNRYQRQRLCTHIALARRMDVVWGETAGVNGQLWLLAPILFILQGFEAYVGMLLLKVALAGVVSEWQHPSNNDMDLFSNIGSYPTIRIAILITMLILVVTCGVLLIVMAVGNFANTVQTLVAKSRFKAKMKKTKSKVELN
ncbi:hypothetical protein CsSME_00007749 [Camellia sinensis var. sinensis]